MPFYNQKTIIKTCYKPRSKRREKSNIWVGSVDFSRRRTYVSRALKCLACAKTQIACAKSTTDKRCALCQFSVRETGSSRARNCPEFTPVRDFHATTLKNIIFLTFKD